MRSRPPNPGSSGWDDYAPFYDWENARTLGRRDVPFWRRVASGAGGRVLELGCGTGRISIPLARAGVPLVGVDLSSKMLARAVARRARARLAALALLRADIRRLPFRGASFPMVLAPYGVLQSLVSERDLVATLDEVARVVRAGGLFGLDLVPDVPNWREYRNRIQLRGRAAGGVHLTLVESVRQDRRRGLTTFEQRYVARRGRRTAGAREVSRRRSSGRRRSTGRGARGRGWPAPSWRRARWRPGRRA